MDETAPDRKPGRLLSLYLPATLGGLTAALSIPCCGCELTWPQMLLGLATGGFIPIHTYDDPAQAVSTARALVEAGAQAVKLEGGVSHVPQIEAIVAEGIAVMGHIGMLPQSVREEGGYKVKGRTQSEAEALVRDGLAVEQAGVFSVVLEIVNPEAARQITSALSIPTIGIGSGDQCDGQILVTHDLIGLFPWFTPKFVSPEARVADEIRKAVQIFIGRTKSGGA